MSKDGCVVSRERPPWFDSMMPCTPYETALMASAAPWIPLMTTGRRAVCWIHGMSSQLSVLSMYWPISLPMPPPFRSLEATAPLMAEETFSEAMRSSASRFPGTWASTVTKMARTPSSRALCRSWVVLGREALT